MWLPCQAFRNHSPLGSERMKSRKGKPRRDLGLLGLAGLWRYSGTASTEFPASSANRAGVMQLARLAPPSPSEQ